MFCLLFNFVSCGTSILEICYRIAAIAFIYITAEPVVFTTRLEKGAGGLLKPPALLRAKCVPDFRPLLSGASKLVSQTLLRSSLMATHIILRPFLDFLVLGTSQK
jgi:hypothetical protein